MMTEEDFQDWEVLGYLDSGTEAGSGNGKRFSRQEKEYRKTNYDLREWAPKPNRFHPERYIPMRGIRLKEEELRELYPLLIYEVYSREIDLELTDAEREEVAREQETAEREFQEAWKTGPGQWDKTEMDPWHLENIDPDGPAFPDEMHYQVIRNFEPIGFEDNEKRLTMMRWGDGDISFDIREWDVKVNARGFPEDFPIPEKGVSLNLDEAGKLCRLIEEEFPDLEKRYGLVDTTTVFREDELRFISNIMLEDADRREQSGLVKTRGNAASVRRSRAVAQRIPGGNALVVSDCKRVWDLLQRQVKLHSGEKDFVKVLNELSEKLTDLILTKEEEIHIEEMNEKVQFGAAYGELKTVCDILDFLYDEIFKDKQKQGPSEYKAEIRERIDAIAVNNRMDKVLERCQDRNKEEQSVQPGKDSVCWLIDQIGFFLAAW